MLRYLKRWTAEWEADLEARPEEVKDSSSGYTATIQFQQTMSFFKPLFKQLKRRQVHCSALVFMLLANFSLDTTGGYWTQDAELFPAGRPHIGLPVLHFVGDYEWVATNEWLALTSCILASGCRHLPDSLLKYVEKSAMHLNQC